MSLGKALLTSHDVGAISAMSVWALLNYQVFCTAFESKANGTPGSFLFSLGIKNGLGLIL